MIERHPSRPGISSYNSKEAAAVVAMTKNILVRPSVYFFEEI